MSWHNLLIFAYLLLGYWLIPRLSLFRESSVATRYWRSLFLLKVLVGVIYSQYHLRYYGGGDTWTFFRESGIYFASLQESFLAIIMCIWSFGISYRFWVSDISSVFSQRV